MNRHSSILALAGFGLCLAAGLRPVPGGYPANGEPAATCPAAHRAKGKPVNLPIFESDWDGSSVCSQPALDRIAVAAAWARATGRGQTVAVLDGGFDLRHEFLAGRLAAEGFDAIDGDADPQDLGNGIDDDAALETPGAAATDRIVGHGTFVASLVLAVAPDATILPVRVLDDEGRGTDAALASGIDFAVSHGASVINLSLVLPDATESVRAALVRAEDAGVVVVAAAGTSDDGIEPDPFFAAHGICVGAADASGEAAAFCGCAAGVALRAPGVDVHGALAGQPSAYGRWSGVSFAVPFVAAGAALLRELHPDDWSAGDVRERLVSRADPTPGAGSLACGRLNLARATSSH